MTRPSSGGNPAADRAVLLFDMDDTLYPELDYMRSGVRHALLAIGIYGCAGSFEAAMVRRFRGGQRSLLMQDAFADIGMAADSNLIATFLTAYRSHTPAISLSATVRTALDRLKSERVDMAVVSDGDAMRQSRKVEALGLRNWFDPILLTATLGVGIDKSSSLPFEWIDEHFGACRQFVFVADNPGKDFTHPLRLGWPSIRIKREDGVYSSSRAKGVLEACDEQHMFEEVFRLLGL